MAGLEQGMSVAARPVTGQEIVREVRVDEREPPPGVHQVDLVGEHLGRAGGLGPGERLQELLVGRLDLVGAVLLGGAVVALMTPLVLSEQDPASAPWWLLGVALVLMLFFLGLSNDIGRLS